MIKNLNVLHIKQEIADKERKKQDGIRSIFYCRVNAAINNCVSLQTSSRFDSVVGNKNIPLSVNPHLSKTSKRPFQVHKNCHAAFAPAVLVTAYEGLQQYAQIEIGNQRPADARQGVIQLLIRHSHSRNIGCENG